MAGPLSQPPIRTASTRVVYVGAGIGMVVVATGAGSSRFDARGVCDPTAFSSWVPPMQVGATCHRIWCGVVEVTSPRSDNRSNEQHGSRHREVVQRREGFRL